MQPSPPAALHYAGLPGAPLSGGLGGPGSAHSEGASGRQPPTLLRVGAPHADLPLHPTLYPHMTSNVYPYANPLAAAGAGCAARTCPAAAVLAQVEPSQAPAPMEPSQAAGSRTGDRGCWQEDTRSGHPWAPEQTQWASVHPDGRKAQAQAEEVLPHSLTAVDQ